MKANIFLQCPIVFVLLAFLKFWSLSILNGISLYIYALCIYALKTEIVIILSDIF